MELSTLQSRIEKRVSTVQQLIVIESALNQLAALGLPDADLGTLRAALTVLLAKIEIQKA